MKLYAGIDLGGTNIAAGLVEGEMITYQTSIPTHAHRGYEALIVDLAELVKSLYIKSGHSIKRVGIGVPGYVDGSSRVVLTCKNLGWADNRMVSDDIEGILAKEDIHLEVVLDNDATAAAAAEHAVGALKDVTNGVLLTLGTGVGSGIIIHDRLYRGSHGLGSEIGHMVIGRNDLYDCECGKNGCFETFSSATALIKHYRNTIEARADLIEDAVERLNELEKLGARSVIEKAKLGDRYALGSYNRFLDHLAEGIINIINTLDPDVIAIGGGVSAAGAFLFENLQTRVDQKLFVKGFEFAKVVPAKLGNDAGIVGAAYL